ncbi:MAG: lycopene cyclase family protein [Acidobacteriota bacterium]
MSRRPLVIGGAGCAGLSLAVHLLEAGVDDRPIVLVEPRTRYENDRTWCFWRLDQHPFEDCVTHSWHRWRVTTPDTDSVAGSRAYPYQHIPANAFYNFAFERLRAASNVELRLGQRIEESHEYGSGVGVETGDGTIDAELFFDSRPTSCRPAQLVQHFHGAFVRAEQPVFDPSTVTLMDFSLEGDPSEIRFFYLLPFSPRTALVEATYISPQVHPPELYRQDIDAYLAHRFDLRGHRVVGRESGVIPMAVVPPARPGRIVPIGTVAGCARASSGYAFVAIQRFSARLAAAIRRGDPLRTSVAAWRPQARFLDRVFLSFLAHQPGKAPAMFANLFGRVPAENLVRFLADCESATDALRVMWAMPKAAFTGEWLRTAVTGRAAA